MKLIKLKINTKTQQYSIIIGSNLVGNISKILKENSINFKQCLLIIDKNISKIIVSKIKKSLNKKKIYVHFFMASEKNKNLNNVNKILEILLNKNFSREDCVISIGGGITGDISGFSASLFKRGLKFINIPTTLLSQVDSSIGGKTGVNTKYGKNLIGSFYQPDLVISDIQFLKTLPKREVVCGYGEILKHSLIASKNFFYFLDKNSNKILNLSSPFIEKAIYESCKIKKSVVEKDEKEKGLRKILNFGHTFAHAIEQSGHFDCKNEIKDLSKFLKSINHFLNDQGVAIKKIRKRSNKFHSRFSAKQRIYKYIIFNQISAPVIENKRGWHVRKPLDLDLIKKGAKKLVGTHDYSTFRSSSCHAKSPIKTIKSVKVKSLKSKIEIEFNSQSFLQQQVRSMVGCLKYLGEKKWDLQKFNKVFKSKKRILCAPPAPPEGLFLMRVIY
ncbi:iron-containing alcohol dehydrogenase [Candidatus Pelagibacter sp.]|nr:iron-containing alcohol dehydrogenase [Candidatus Pelagibacter sp.]